MDEANTGNNPAQPSAVMQALQSFQAAAEASCGTSSSTGGSSSNSGGGSTTAAQQQQNIPAAPLNKQAQSNAPIPTPPQPQTQQSIGAQQKQQQQRRNALCDARGDQRYATAVLAASFANIGHGPIAAATTTATSVWCCVYAVLPAADRTRYGGTAATVVSAAESAHFSGPSGAAAANNATARSRCNR